VRVLPLLAYSGEGEPKEHGGEPHNGIEPSSPRELLPLDVTGRDKERNKHAYRTHSSLAKGLQTIKARGQALTVQYALQECPKEGRKRITDPRHLGRSRGQKTVVKPRKRSCLFKPAFMSNSATRLDCLGLTGPAPIEDEIRRGRGEAKQPPSFP
jgi:hypothetical protein